MCACACVCVRVSVCPFSRTIHAGKREFSTLCACRLTRMRESQIGVVTVANCPVFKSKHPVEVARVCGERSVSGKHSQKLASLCAAFITF